MDATCRAALWNVIRVDARCHSASLLLYPDFYDLAHPRLHVAMKINIATGKTTVRRYVNQRSRPVLHRKETMVAADDPWHGTFAKLTEREQSLGLLSASKAIGSEGAWSAVLQSHGVAIRGHDVVEVDTDG